MVYKHLYYVLLSLCLCIDDYDDDDDGVVDNDKNRVVCKTCTRGD